MPTVSIMTQYSLELLSAGATMNFAGSDLFEISETAEGQTIRAVYSRADQASDALIVIAASEKTNFLPDSLRRHREAAYQRMLSFIQRVGTYPVTLPRGWKQYKHDNLMGLFPIEGVGDLAGVVAVRGASLQG